MSKKTSELETTKKARTETFTLSADGTTESITHGSGNVFADLGLEDADELQFKASLILSIERAIAERGLTQAATAKLVGVDQPRLSKMLRGEFLSFSVEKLFDILNRLGRNVEVRVVEDDFAPEARTLLVA